MAVHVLQFAAGSFHIRNFVEDYSMEIEFYFLKHKNRFLSHPLGDLRVTYALHM